MSTQPLTPGKPVTVRGKQYLVRFSTGAFYLLSKWGLPSERLAGILNEYFKSERNTEAMLMLAAASLGNFDISMEWHTAGFEPLTLADKIDDNPEEMKALFETVWREFLGKTGLEEKKAAPVPAKTTTEPAEMPNMKTSTNPDGSEDGLSQSQKPD